VVEPVTTAAVLAATAYNHTPVTSAKHRVTNVPCYKCAVAS